MATPYAFVTLITSNSYLPGALALVAALKDLHPGPPTSPEVDFQTVCLVTPETVDVTSIKLLRGAFNVVIGVEIIEQEDERNLRLLGRLDLGTVLTKLHVFRLTQYSKIIFLDADVLPIRPLSHLFTLPHEFSAVPDVGWPDIFNSGVLVLSPGHDKFDQLMKLQKTKGSWDGGDQGLLNEWRGSDWNRLSFVYNTTPTAAYTYAPAYERFGSGISAIHFIGENKPWKGLLYRSPGIKSSETSLPDGTKRVYNYEALVDRWYDVYDRHYRQEPVLPTPDFLIPTYSSAWDDGASIGAELPAASNMSASGSGSALGLDELRKAAVDGMNAVSRSSSGSFSLGSSVGEYLSMPLDGRIDLMRPQKHPDPEPPNAEGQGSHIPSQAEGSHTGSSGVLHAYGGSAEAGYFPSQGSSTPAPHEVPNAPYIHGHSLPPTETPTPNYGAPGGDHSQHASLFNNSLQVFYQSQAQSEPGSEYDVVSQLRNQQYLAQSYEQNRNAQFTSQQQYYEESSDSDSPVPPTPFYPHTGRHYHHHQQSQQSQQLYQHDHHHSHPQTGQQHEIRNKQQRGPGDQRVEQWTKDQRQRGGIRQAQERPYQGQRRRDSYSQPQRPGGNITPSQQDYRTQIRYRQPGSRGESPILSGEHTPTQGTYGGNYARPPEGQRGHESPRTHRQHHAPQGQHHVHFSPSLVQHEYHPSEQQRYHDQPSYHHPPPPPRPGTPPKLNWNPAIEPPPKESPPISTFPEDTYFPNVWDQPPSPEHDATHQSLPSPNRSDVFFNPPPPPTIPEQLIREGKYSNVLGHVDQGSQPEGTLSPPVPDKSKVHAIFPWEEKPRHVPRRVFPRSDAPVPGANYIESERTSSPVSTPPAPIPIPIHAVSQPPSSPVQGIPWGTSFSNAWDTVPSIQKYASKLVGNPRLFPHLYMTPPPPADDNWRRQWREQREKDWQDQQDASSMDGDDEDEGESDDERQSEGRGGGGGSSKRRGSSSKSKKQYRTRGVQASPETDVKEVQVEILKDNSGVQRVSIAVGSDTALVDPITTPDSSTPAAPSADLALPTAEAPVTGKSSFRKQWQDSTPFRPGSALLPSAVPRDFSKEPEQGVGTPAVNTSARPGMPFPSMASPTGLRSPATLSSPRTYSPPRVVSPGGTRSPSGTHSPVKVRSPLASPPMQASAPMTLSPKVQTPLQSPRGSVSLQTSSSPQIGLSRSMGSPRPAGTPRRVSVSSLPSSSRAHSPVLSTTSRLQTSHATPSPKHLRMTSITTSLATSSSMQRTASADTYVTPSPSTTNDSLATPGDTPVEPRQRRGSRVWDPARGVDVFKRSSEEVLAKFLRMGSFDDDEKQQRQHSQP